MTDPLLAEEAKRILMGANILQSRSEEGFSLAVTSAVAGEGKTRVSIALALALASEFETQCLLIDANWQRPALGPLLGVEQRHAFRDYLDDTLSCVCETPVKNLYLLPAPQLEKSESNFAMGESLFKQLMQQALSRYGAVIYDCPEILHQGRALLDPLIPASVVRRLILVYLANHTSKHDALRSKYIIQNVNNDIGVVMNDYKNDFYLG